jgi:hypothetical protein
MKLTASGAPRTHLANALIAAIAVTIVSIAPAAAQSLPGIRTTDANKVPACVTPARLMAYLRDRNPRLDPRYDAIATWYKTHGETWRVRWDYAFYQMVIETNGLLFRTGSGKPGDVNAKQNNFAGIGTTGGGVPGDGFPDVSTGVLAQIQHLVAYSGERMDQPVAPRTRLHQDNIIALSSRLKRPVTFTDLAGRWAVDRRYARSIESIADRFRQAHCTGRSTVPDEPERAPSAAAPIPKPTKATANSPPRTPRTAVAAAVQLPRVATDAVEATPPPAPTEIVAPDAGCRVQAASYVGSTGSRKTLLIRAVVESEVHFTALQVLDGFERSMADTFIRSRAPGGSTVAEFGTSDAAIARAYELCPSGK